MLIYVVLTRRMHICDMFDEMFVMASRGPVNSLFKYFNLYIFLMLLFISISFMEFWVEA